MQKFVALWYIYLSALPSNISKSTELCKGFSQGSAVTKWSYAGRGFSCHTNIGQNYKKNLRKGKMCNLSFTISLSWSVQGWNRLGHPLASQTPPTPQTQFLYSPRPLVTDLHNVKKKKRVATNKTNIYLLLFNDPVYPSLKLSKRERERERAQGQESVR